MSQAGDRPRVGVGVIVLNKEGNVLIGKRKGSHAQFYSIPGGHLDEGETFEEAAIREVKEELDIEIKNPQVVAVTNNLETFRQEKLHYISIILLAKEFSGTPRIMEPEKCEEIVWVNPRNLPTPHFDASRRGIDCYLEGKFYKRYE